MTGIGLASFHPGTFVSYKKHIHNNNLHRECFYKFHFEGFFRKILNFNFFFLVCVLGVFRIKIQGDQFHRNGLTSSKWNGVYGFVCGVFSFFFGFSLLFGCVTYHITINNGT